MLEIFTRRAEPAFHQFDDVFDMCCSGAVLPVVVGSCVPRDMEHPGLEAAFISKRPAVLQDSEKDVLHEILCGGPVAGHFCKEIEQPAVVPVEEEAELVGVSFSYGEHQLFVGLVHFHSR